MKPMNRWLVMLLHDLTQQNYRVSFERDFEGMLTIAFFYRDSIESLHHEHLGQPGMPPEQLDERVIKCLETFAATNADVR